MSAQKVQPKSKRKGAPARSVEARENQLINLAVELAEKQLLEGTASAQVITHFLKLGSTSERLEKEKLVQENKLLKAKTESLETGRNIEELYLNALKSMTTYSGGSEPEDDD